MYILYGGHFTRALITEMVMAEGGIPYELRNVDIVAQEHRRPEYLAINPAGWVPALVTPEGATLYETPAINLYLAERHGLTHLAPAPGDPDRGIFLSGLFSVTGDLEADPEALFLPAPLRVARRRHGSHERAVSRGGARTPAGHGAALARPGTLSSR